MATENQLSLGSDEQKVSYGLGRQFGQHLTRTRIDGLDLEAVIAGMEQAYLGQPSVIADSDLEAAYEAIETKLNLAARERDKRIGQLSAEYLERNAHRNKVTVTDSGLQYEILERGEGEHPADSDRVRVHYHGTLVDGTVFDSSVERGTAAEFGVGEVIAGWREALNLMPVGSRWRLAIPAQLAYGSRGAGDAVPPDAALLFEVELIEILR